MRFLHNFDTAGTMLERYKKFKATRIIEDDPLLVWCIRPGCGKTVKAFDRYTR